MPLKNWIKYLCILFELFLRRTYRRSKLCLQFLKPIFLLFIPWVVLIFTICIFENKSFGSVLYETKYDIFTSVVLAGISVLTIKIPQYKMYLKRRYSLEYDVDMAIYCLREVFEKEEIDVV